MTDIHPGIDQDEADAQRLAEGLRHLRELRSFHDRATADLEAGREAGRQRVAALQAEVDDENSKLADIANEAALEFNNAAAGLVETGFASPKVLTAKGLGTLRVKK
ncbi:hypothetical protein [Mycolicibacterium sp.]|uniref:hypothetical protein n=1 Tax=Mycolicibacterium sp. TaxID=2320850 RepID=UPI00355F278F